MAQQPRDDCIAARYVSVNRFVSMIDDRIEWLGKRFELWSFVDSPELGATVDWPGWPLAITKESDGPAMECPTTAFDERVEHGPWSSAPRPSPSPRQSP